MKGNIMITTLTNTEARQIIIDNSWAHRETDTTLLINIVSLIHALSQLPEEKKQILELGLLNDIIDNAVNQLKELKATL